jgi:GNAT superfamily N-acetyltransferase
MDKKKNPFYQHAEAEFFLAQRDGDIVGRIGAIYNHNHNREHNENVGFFGFFECMNDQEVANALFDAVRDYLARFRVTAIRGPASPSVNDEYGMLIEGFDRPPMILMSYNPPYYPALAEAYGFRKAKDTYSWFVHKDKVFSDKMVRVSEAAKKRQGVVYRSLNMKDFENEVKRVHKVYSRGWVRNWGEVPLTDAEFAYMAADLKAIVVPDMVVIAEVKGEVVGFGLSLPDYNEILIKNRRGWLLPGLLRILLFRKRIRQARIIILGVLPEFANAGIGGVLFYETARRIVNWGIPCGEASWVLEDNVMMNRGAQLLNGEIVKRHRIFELPLT